MHARAEKPSEKLLRRRIFGLRCSEPLQGAFAFAHANRFVGGEHAPRNPCYAYLYASAPQPKLRPLATLFRRLLSDCE
jgi:hypothetical protein